MKTENMTRLLLTFLIFPLFAVCLNMTFSVPPIKGERANFSLTLITYNHAELLFEGTLTYTVNDSCITIYNRKELSGKDNVIFSKRIKETSLHQIKAVKLDTIKRYYNNKCIMPTSGSEYDISITKGAVTKNVHLHHYYQREIDQLIICMNKLLPVEYTIEYVSRKTKQDCD
jgi:hypothetical protein